MQPKYQQIANDLQKEIESGKIAVGAALPSASELRKKYSVSQITIAAAYRLLLKQQILEKEPGKSYIVHALHPAVDDYSTAVLNIPESSKSTGCICSLMRSMIPGNPDDDYTNEINCGIMQECSRLNFSLIYPPHLELLIYDICQLGKIDFSPLMFQAMRASRNCDGFLFDARLSDEFIARVLHETGKPGVVIDRTSSLDIDVVVAPNRAGVMAMCEKARRYGYRRFLFIRNSDCSCNSMERVRAFEEFAAKLPRENWRIVDDWTAVVKEDMLPALYRAYDDLHSGEPVAVIVGVDRFAQPARRLLEEHGAVLGRDFGIVAMGGIHGSMISEPPLTLVNFDRLEMGSLAVKALVRRISGDNTPRMLMHPHWNEVSGETL